MYYYIVKHTKNIETFINMFYSKNETLDHIYYKTNYEEPISVMILDDINFEIIQLTTCTKINPWTKENIEKSLELNVENYKLIVTQPYRTLKKAQDAEWYINNLLECNKCSTRVKIMKENV